MTLLVTVNNIPPRQFGYLQANTKSDTYPKEELSQMWSLVNALWILINGLTKRFQYLGSGGLGWSSGQLPCLLLRWSDFESCWVLFNLVGFYASFHASVINSISSIFESEAEKDLSIGTWGALVCSPVCEKTE